MIIEIVQPHMAAMTWPLAAPLLAMVEPHVRGDWTLDQLKADVLTNRLGLMVAREAEEVKGAAVVSFQNRRNARTAFITALAGRGITDAENFDQLKAVLAQQGCTEIEAAMRDSTFRLWGRLGFAEKYRVAGTKI